MLFFFVFVSLSVSSALEREMLLSIQSSLLFVNHQYPFRRRRQRTISVEEGLMGLKRFVYLDKWWFSEVPTNFVWCFFRACERAVGESDIPFSGEKNILARTSDMWDYKTAYIHVQCTATSNLLSKYLHVLRSCPKDDCTPLL